MLRLVLDSMDEACALYDAADRLVVCNRAFASAFKGQRSAAAPGTRFRDHVRWFLDHGLILEARGREAAWMRERMRRHRNPDGPIHVRNPNGRWSEIVERRTRDGGTLLLRRDITRLKEREADVAASEARFRALFENAPVAITAYDYSAVRRRVERLRARGIEDIGAHLEAHPRTLRAMIACIVPLDANRHAVRLHGARTRDQALAQIRADFEAGRFIASPADIAAFARGEGEASLEGLRRMRDGSWRYLRSRFFLDPAHRADWSRVVGVTEDVTELHEANRVLSAYQGRWRAFLDNAPVSIGIKDREGRFTEVSAHLARTWGRPADELVGLRIADIAPPEIARAIAREDRAAMATRNAVITHRSWPSINGLPPTESLVVRFPIVDGSGDIVGTGFVESDLTEEVRTRQALAASEALFRLVMDTLPAIVWMTDPEGRTTFHNKAWSELTGVADGQDATFDWDARVHPDDRAGYDAVYRRIRAGGAPERVEFRFLAADGRYRWLLESATPRSDERGRLTGFVGTSIDVTDRRLAEEAAREGEERFRFMADGAPVLLWLSDLEHRHIFVNRAWRAFTGAAAGQELREGWRAFMHPDDVERVVSTYLAAAAGGRPYQVEYRFRRHDGEWRWLLETAQPRRDSTGAMLGYAGSCQDITEMRQAEEALRDSRALLRAALDSVPASINVKDREGRFMLVNRHLAELYGRTPAELEGWLARDVRPGFYAADVSDEQHDQVVATGRPILGNETISGTGHAREIWSNSKVPVLGEDGRVKFVVTTSFNITEIKRAEQALAESEARLRDAEERAGLAHWHIDVATGRNLWSASAAAVFGRPHDTLPENMASYLAIVHPADRDRVAAAYESVLSGGGQHRVEYRVLRPDGSVIWIEERGEVALRADGSRDFDLGTVQDITGLKRAQEALAESEARLREAEERARLTHWHVDPRTGRLGWSDSAAAILGIAPRDLPATNEAFWSYVHPDDAPWYRAASLAAVRRGGSTHYEFRFVRPDGRTIWLEEHGQVTLGPDGAFTRDVGTLQDITARKRAEGELRANRAKLADAQRRAKLAYWEVERDSGRYLWSEDAEQVLGLEGIVLPDSREGYFALLDDEDRARVAETYARTRRDLAQWSIEYRLNTAAGPVWISEVGETLPPSASEGMRFAGTVQNVTERKLAEEELRLSRAQLADAQRRARIAYWDWNLATGRYTWSDEVGLVLGCEAAAVPHDDPSYMAIVAPEDRDRLRAQYDASEADPAPYQIEYRVMASDGGIRWMRELGEALRDGAGRVVGLVGTVQDVTAVKQAEEALRRNEALLRGVMDAVPGAINVKDRDGRYVMVNSFQAKSFGLSPAAFTGLTHFDVGSNRAYDEWLASIEQQVLATGQGTGFFDDPYPDPQAGGGDRRTHWLTSKTPILDDRGAVSHIVGVSIDITDRRRAEDEALRRGAALAAVSTAAVRFLAAAEWRDVMEETLAELGDSVGASACYVLAFEGEAGDGRARVVSIWVTPGEGPVKDTPKAAAGYTVAIPPRWHEAWAAGRPTIGLATDMPADERAVLEAEGIRSVASLPIFMGSRLWGAIAFDQTDHERVWTFAETDVLRAAASVIGAALARKAADDAAAESRSALMTVIDALPAHINARDRKGRYTFLNRKEAEWLGVAPEQAIGRTLSEIQPATKFSWQETHERVLETGQPIEAYPESGQDANGQDIDWLTTKTPLRGPDGRIDGVITVSVDMTEQRRLEEQLRQAQKMEAVGQLTGGIAHDFNNLLAVILGNLELVAEDLPQDDPLRAQVEIAIRATLRGSELTHRLLAFARRQPLAPSIVDVNVLVGGMTDLLKRSLGSAIAVRIALRDGLWLTEVDYAQLETSILNLAINARDAMPRGGTLVIETSNVSMTEDDPARMEEMAPGDYVAVTVRDSGCGMPPEVLARVFEPFFTTKGVGKGTGLGLSMVYGFVRQSGGQTRIESEPGQGTTVTLYLPRARDAATALALEARIPEGTEGRGENVLVVEDEPAMRDLARRMLADMGYKVILAEDGPAALAALDAAARVDVMLVDVVLGGGMYGTAVAAQARERRPGLKVLFMSGYTATAVTQGGLLDPGVNLVPKPFRRAELAVKLRQVLAGSPG